MVNRSQNSIFSKMSPSDNIPCSIFDIPCSIFDIQSSTSLIKLTNMKKKEVDQGYIAAGMHQQTIDLRNLNPGMYLCCIEANGIIADTQKLLKVE